MGDSSISYNIGPISSIKDFVKSSSINKISQCSSMKHLIVFITDMPAPFLYNTLTERCTEFQLKNSYKSIPISVDISADLKFVATGYEDGRVCLWSINDLCFIRVLSDEINEPVPIVQFGINSKDVFICTTSGRIISLTLRSLMGISSVFSTKVYLGDEKIFCLISVKESPYIFAQLSRSFLIINSESKKVTLASQVYESEIYIDAKQINDHIVLTVTSVSSFSLVHFFGNERLKTIAEVSVSNPYLIGKILSSGMFFCVTSNGTMYLYSDNGKIVFENNSMTLSQITAASSFNHIFNDQLLLLHGSTVFSLSFIDWKDSMLTLINNLQFEEAFRSLVSLNLGMNKDFVGIPNNLSRFHLDMKVLSLKLCERYLSKAIENGNKDNIVNSFTTALTHLFILDIPETITALFPIIETTNYQIEFYQTYFLCLSQSTCKEISIDFITKYLDIMKAKGLLDDAENVLQSIKFSPYVKNDLIDVFSLFNMKYLLFRVFIDNDDYITACKTFYKIGKIEYFLEKIFRSQVGTYSIECLRSIAMWILRPDSNKQFARLRGLFTSDWSKADFFVKQFLLLCPIPISKSKLIMHEHVLDAVLHTIKSDSYDKVSLIMDVVCPYYRKLAHLPPSSTGLKHIISWVLYSQESNRNKELVFSKIIHRFSELIPYESLSKICRQKGFVSLAIDYCLPKNDFLPIIGAYINNPSQQKLVYQFLMSHIKNQQQIQAALLELIDPLIDIDPIQTVTIISKFLPHMKKPLLSLLSKFKKYLFLRALHEISEGLELSPDQFLELFEYICEYDPQNASHFLYKQLVCDFAQSDSNNSLSLPKVISISKKYHRLDCEIRVYTFQSNYQQAISLIGDEMKESLIRLIEMKNVPQIASVEQLMDLPQYSRPISALKTAIDLLTELKNEEENILQWQSLYKVFQFPLYLSSKSPSANVVLLLFSYFVVESFPIIGSDLAFRILSIFFSGISSDQYRSVLSNVFARLNYETTLCNMVERIMVSDFTRLDNNLFFTHTKGLVSRLQATCVVCKEPLSKSGEPFQLFSCGHCYHENSKCGYRTSCSLCSGSIIDKGQLENDQNTCSSRQQQSMLRRFTHFLPKKSSESLNSISETSVFFSKRSEDVQSDNMPFDIIPISTEMYTITLEIVK